MRDSRKVAVVTGGSAGIGLAVVKRLLAGDFRVAFFGRDRGRLKAGATGMAELFDRERILARPLDLCDAGGVCSFMAEVVDRWGGISVLVNNAGISPKKDGVRIPLHETTLEDWAAVMSVNLTGAFLCCRAVLPGMMDDGYGRIVNIGSIAARMLPVLAGAPYVATKSALAGLTRAIAGEYARFGITANTVAPGNVASNMTGGPRSPVNLAAAERIPLNRIGMPDDIAGAVAFLCSAEADFINGAVIDVNGGEMTAP